MPVELVSKLCYPSGSSSTSECLEFLDPSTEVAYPITSKSNPVQLFDCHLGDMARSDATRSERFEGVVNIISRIRDRLVSNRAFREPYVKLIANLYSNRYRGLDTFLVRPRPPPHRSILFFFTHRWPDVHLVPQDDGIWGSPNAETGAIDESAIHISYSFVDHWLKTANGSKRRNMSANRLCVQFLIIFLTELAQRMVVWWSKGTCVTPEHMPILAEAGRFIQSEFFGGVVKCMWKPGREGMFRYLQEHILDPQDGTLRWLDADAASLILRNFQTFRARLPLLEVSSLMTVTPDRSNVSSMNRYEDDDNTTGTGVTPYRVGKLFGVGLVTFGGIGNDKIHID